MAEVKESRRVRYTKKVLKDSLLEQLAIKPLDKITVKTVCENADVNRGTFYAHYKDVDDLMQQIENEIFESISSRIVPVDGDKYFEMVIGIFTELNNNIELFKVLLSENGNKRFVRRLLYIPHNQVVSVWRQEHPEVKTELLEVAYAYLVSGAVGVIAEWIKGDYLITQDEFMKFLMSFWKKGFTNFIEQN